MRKTQVDVRRILTSTEKDRIRMEIRECEAQLRSPDLVGLNGTRGMWAANPAFSAAHSDTMARRMVTLKRRLESGSVEDLSRATVKRRETRIKELEERVANRLVPQAFYHQKRQDSRDYDKTVRHVADTEMSKEHQAEVAELKNLLRARSAAESRLSGSVENPMAGSIEYLRK